MRKYGVIVLVFLAACAKVVAPSGGPADISPPEVISIFPETGFVDSIPQTVRILFSEKISLSITDVQLYPQYAGEVSIRDREIEVTTDSCEGILILNISSNLEDVRGNSLSNPVTFVWNSKPEDHFATADVTLLRNGGGSVTANARCEFYLLPDTTSPQITYYPDTTGLVHAGWLTAGNYRIVSYEDIDQSRSWDPEREPGTSNEVAIPSGDLMELTMIMTIIDSIGPRMYDLLVLDGWHLEVLWNEQISIGVSDEDLVRITGPDTLPVEVYGISLSGGRSSTSRMTVYTEELSDTLYSFSIQGVSDLAGNPSLADTLEFWATDSLPSAKLAVQSAYPADGGVQIPPSGPFYISFSDWVDDSAISLLYSVTRVSDSTAVSGDFCRTSATAFSFTPHSELLGDRQYRIDLSQGYVSLQGDSLIGQSWTFIPEWSQHPGSVSGNVSGTGATVVTMVVTPAGNDGEILTAVFAPGAYSFAEVPGGRYTVSVFVDWNSDGTWDPGEPYGAWPGVVEVLPGIETEEINIQVVP